SRGDREENRVKSRTHRVQNVLLQRDSEVADAYQVVSTPGAVLIKERRIASRVAAGPDAIRALVTKAVTPPALNKGDPAPSLRLHDLDGGTRDLASLEGRRTLLLFWNPSCGFCRAMLDEVKGWEDDREAGAPDLIIISAGSPRANREQGFRSRVLLDPRFRAGDVFGAGGTPSAVMIDEHA